MEDLVRAWAKQKGIDPAPYMPTIEAETDRGPIYAFPEWQEHRAVLEPLVDQAVAYIKTTTGVVSQVALVWVEPISKLNTHIHETSIASRPPRSPWASPVTHRVIKH